MKLKTRGTGRKYTERPRTEKLCGMDDKLNDDDSLLYTSYTAIPPRRFKYLKLVKGKTQAYIDKLSKV